MTNRFQVLDGWRGISILLVLAGHLFPLGPKSWQMNWATAASGMAVFFILSGFLITNLLLRDSNVIHFLIKRFMRIIPLAWLFIGVTLVFSSSGQEKYLPHFLFYANWEPIQLTPNTGHLWSLCVEMQFYVAIALLIAVFNYRALYLLPLICVSVTYYRYISNVQIAINTYYRVDEVLAGCMLALLNNYSNMARRLIGLLDPIYMLPLLLLSAHPEGGVINYFRPYIAMLTIGSTLFKQGPAWWFKWLNSKALLYLASISYAVYLIHGGLTNTWLGDGDKVEKYMKRPLLLAVTFVLAHISTFYYEKHWIALGKKLTSK